MNVDTYIQYIYMSSIIRRMRTNMIMFMILVKPTIVTTNDGTSSN